LPFGARVEEVVCTTLELVEICEEIIVCAEKMIIIMKEGHTESSG
jgi:hypothetical protein